MTEIKTADELRTWLLLVVDVHKRTAMPRLFFDEEHWRRNTYNHSYDPKEVPTHMFYRYDSLSASWNFCVGIGEDGAVFPIGLDYTYPKADKYQEQFIVYSPQGVYDTLMKHMEAEREWPK